LATIHILAASDVQLVMESYVTDANPLSDGRVSEGMWRIAMVSMPRKLLKVFGAQKTPLSTI
jgi:hypothetical protein